MGGTRALCLAILALNLAALDGAAATLRLVDPEGDAMNTPLILTGQPNPAATDGDLLSIVVTVEGDLMSADFQAAGPEGVETSPGYTLVYMLQYWWFNTTAAGEGSWLAERTLGTWRFEALVDGRKVPLEGGSEMGSHRVHVEAPLEVVGVGAGSLLNVTGAVFAIVEVGPRSGGYGGFGDFDLVFSQGGLRLPYPEVPDVGPIALPVAGGGAIPEWAAWGLTAAVPILVASVLLLRRWSAGR